jgi:tyrosyl-tRNA synthetase
MNQVRELGSLQGADLRQAKEVLAFEATRITHGEEEANKARETSRALFGGGGRAAGGASAYYVSGDRLRDGIPAHELFSEAFGKSRREAREIVNAGGCYFDDEPVRPGQGITREGLLRWGKKDYRRLVAV